MLSNASNTRESAWLVKVGIIEALHAVSALAMEGVIVMLVVRYMGLAVRLGVAVAVFVVLALAGFGVWHKKTAGEWRKLAVG